MSLSRSLAIALLSTTLVAAGACRDGTAPPPEVEPDPVFSIDAQHATANVELMRAVFRQPAFLSLRNSLANTSALFAFRAFPTLSVLPADGMVLSGALAVPALVPTPSALSDVVIDDARGKTYAYASESHAFLPDPSLFGAPFNGFRLVLPAWEENFQAPTLPVTRLGYADFTPLDASSSASRNGARVQLVRDQGGAELATYTVLRTTNGDATRLDLAGSAANDNMQVQFDVREVATASSPLAEFAWSVSAPSRGIEAELRNGTPAQLTVKYDGHSLTIPFGPSGEVRVDGRLYAKFTTTGEGAEARATYTKADGTPFTTQEKQELDALTNSAILATMEWIGLVWR